MFVPIIKKVIYSNNVLIERALPHSGVLKVEKGQKVEPFTELGACKMSMKHIPLDAKLKLEKGKSEGSFFNPGEKIGSKGNKVVTAPFAGILTKRDKEYVFEEKKRDSVLLAGLWGEVMGVSDNISVLIKSQVTDLHLAACTDQIIEGELVVFPNPSEILQAQYLQKYAKNVYKKILYVGGHAETDLIENAVSLGVGGILAGSADRSAFILAKNGGIFLGVFSGFGEIPPPEIIFNTLKNVSNRYVFVQGKRHLVRIPMPQEFGETEVNEKRIRSTLKKVEQGLAVLVLDKTYFGWTGRVEKISDSSILIKLDKNDRTIEVKQSNILALM